MRWAGPVPGIPDATIMPVAHLPAHLSGAERAGLYAEAKAGQLLLVIPGVARYLVRDGVTIEVAPEADADRDAVELFLNGGVRAALIHQRGELPFHAATMIAPTGNSAIAICGPSGIGKSTLAAELSRRGWLLLADDMTRLTWNGQQTIAWPGGAAIKLWGDACKGMEEDITGLKPVRPGIQKFFLPVALRNETMPLGKIVELSMSAALGMQIVSGLERMALLSEHTFRVRQVRPLGVIAQHFRMVAQVADATSVWRLGGARKLTVAALADQIVEGSL